ncbi:glutathione S-transferase family protein [Leptospira ilyithenensis]|uniref:Glutathione S-transferase family protein n=1 Tax=Leptospira ilyithenensis TaxID=2484901 RepID=A0A4R9LPN2_9LEPT|nr:glutathione S-transferase family protein [Leptospira ilyithenensis]TGN08141.1 glutathione S-transferase family protein [Leptospira ilyithenensis]
MEKPTLISFKLCPFVQRSVITLLEKKADYEIKYIDLANKPDWFLKISPLGRVPVLQLGEHVLFESAVINEYLDEVNPPSLHPRVPIEKAKQRAWIEFASSVNVDQYMLTLTKDKVEFDKKLSDLNSKFSQLEAILPNGFSDSLYFGGKTFQLVDTSFAPAFMRFDFLEKSKANLRFFESFPKVSLWSKTLLSKDSVKNSVLPEVPEDYIRYIKDHNSYLGSLI